MSEDLVVPPIKEQMRTCHPHPIEDHDKNESRRGEQSSISKGGGEYSTTKGGDYYSSDLCQFCIIIMPANKQTNKLKQMRDWDPLATMTELYCALQLCLSSGGTEQHFQGWLGRGQITKTNKYKIWKPKQTNKQSNTKGSVQSNDVQGCDDPGGIGTPRH